MPGNRLDSAPGASVSALCPNALDGRSPKKSPLSLSLIALFISLRLSISSSVTLANESRLDVPDQFESFDILRRRTV